MDRLKLRKEDAAEARPFVVPLPGPALAILERLRAEAGESPWVLASPKDPKKHIGEKVLVRALSRLQDGKRLALGEGLTVTICGARGAASPWTSGSITQSRGSASATLGSRAWRASTVGPRWSSSAPRPPSSSPQLSTGSGLAKPRRLFRCANRKA